MTNKILNRLIFSSKKRISLFRETPVNRQGFLLLNLSKYIQQDILRKLKNEEIINLLHYLDPDEATDILQNIKKERRERIVKELNLDIREKIEFLLRFDPKTAAGLMNLNYIEVDKDFSFKKVSQIVQDYEKRTNKFPEILVVKEGFLLGELEGHSLFSHRKGEKIDRYIKKIPSIKYNKEEKEVLSLFRENPSSQIVVLDEDESILGIIYSNDILKLINKEFGEGLSSFAGVSEQEDVYDPVFQKVKNRYKWLIINLGTAFLAASVVGYFKQTISSFVLLAVYMPIVAGMGGNAGTQTLAVVVRGIALREIRLSRATRVIINEILAGAINGIINGAIVAGVAFLFNKNPLLGLIVGLSMVINLIIAGFFGTIIPLLMKRLGKDPASSATIFITTATDVGGFFVFLGLATLLL